MTSTGRNPTRTLALSLRALLLAAGVFACVAAYLPALGVPLPWSRGASAATVFRCPMHPRVVSRTEEDCPICRMRLEPVSRAAADAAPAEAVHPGGGAPSGPGGPPVPGLAPFEVSPAQYAAGGLRTARVQRRWLEEMVQVPAELEPVPGRIEARAHHEGLIVDACSVGRAVRAGERVVTIRSARFVEAAAALRAPPPPGAAGGSPIEPGTNAELQRLMPLRALGLSPAEVDKALRTRTLSPLAGVDAPQAGRVIACHATVGQTVHHGALLFTIAPEGAVATVRADVASDVARALRPGQRVLFRPLGPSTSPLAARISAEPPGRGAVPATATVRAILDEPEALPGAAALGMLDLGRVSRQVLLAPAAGVVRSARGTFVFVASEGGTFTPRAVREGRVLEGQMILSDPPEGTEILAAGTAFAELESAVRAGFAGATSAPADAPPPAPAEQVGAPAPIPVPPPVSVPVPAPKRTP